MVIHQTASGPNCEWIVFDAVGTLIRPEPSVAAAYHGVAAKYGSRLSVSEISERFRRAFRRSEEMVFCNDHGSNGATASSDEIEAARWRWIVDQVVPDVLDRDRCFADLWDHFARPSSWSCFDDVEQILTALKYRGYRLAIASNFDSRLHTVCAGHPTLKIIERCFVSSETGCRKPAPEFYSKVIMELGSPPERILMVGDDPEHDVAGPQAAGMQAILLDRQSREPAADDTNFNAIRSLNQLIAGHAASDRLNGSSAFDQTSQ